MAQSGMHRAEAEELVWPVASNVAASAVVLEGAVSDREESGVDEGLS